MKYASHDGRRRAGETMSRVPRAEWKFDVVEKLLSMWRCARDER